MRGLIIKTESALLTVVSEGTRTVCRPRGRFRRDGISPLAGDLVEFEAESDGSGVITEVCPRRNSLVRPPVANIERLVIVVSAAPPVTGLTLIDSLTALAEYKSVRPVICVNKCDVADVSQLRELYSAAGYRVIITSAATGEGTGELREELAGGISVLTGNSGVGKSSLLNALGFTAVTGELSERIGRGRQTTRRVELLPLGDGWIADTPGYSSFDALEMEMTDPERLPYCFPEFVPYLGSCRYADCGHTGDDGCAVCAAVKDGKIAASRHENYIRLRARLKEYKPWEEN